MKKIAIFQRDLGVGGIQKSVINFLKNIDLTKYQIDLYLFDKNIFYTDPLPKEVNITFLSPLNKIYKFIPFGIVKIFKKYNIEKNYDVVIDYNSYDPSCALAAINTKSKRRIMWIHNDVEKERKNDIKYRILRFFFKGKYKYFNEYVAVSKGIIDPFVRLNKVKKAKFYTVPNIIDTKEIIEKSKEKCDLQVDETKYNLVSVGRLTIQKGFDLLIDDMKEITKHRKDIHLYIIGDGALKQSLENQIKENNLTDYITLLGSKPNPFKYESLMNGFIIRSRYEGQGMVILEAAALGLELIIPEHLSPYIEDVPFTKDIVNTVVNSKKKTIKQTDTLDNYNKKIIDKLNEILNK